MGAHGKASETAFEEARDGRVQEPDVMRVPGLGDRSDGVAPNGQRHTGDVVFRFLVYAAGIAILFVLGAVLLFLLARAWPVFAADDLQASSTFQGLSGGKASGFWQYVGPLLFGTVIVSALALAIAFFVAIGVALFIVYYAPKWLARVLNAMVDLLAAIPSVIYGLWGSTVLVPASYGFWRWLARYFGWIPLFVGPAAAPPRTVATVSVVLAVMIMPIIASMTRDLFTGAPQLTREAALALGATKWEAIRMAVLPVARSGMVSASMLALGRAFGETMAVMMILSPGLTYSLRLLQASHTQTIAANIASQFPEASGLGVSALIATGLVLFLVTFGVNAIARAITTRATGVRESGDSLWQDIRHVVTRFVSKVAGWFKADTGTIRAEAAGAHETGQVASDVTQERKADVHVAGVSVDTELDFARFRPTSELLHWRKAKNGIMSTLILCVFVFAMIPLVSLLWTTIQRGAGRLNLNFLTYNMSGVVGGRPTPSGGYGGAEHAIIGTLEVTFGAMAISVPLGILCAVYLTEYAHGGKLAHAVAMMVGVMSGVPSIVAGLFAYSLFTIVFGPGMLSGFEGSVALSLLMVPTVVNSSVEMIRAVPVDLREAAYALGVTKQRTITRIVLRTALPGIISGVLLAIARVIGETAPLLMTAGFISTTNWNLFSGQMTTLPVYVYQEYQKLSVTCTVSAGPACIADIPTQRAWAAALVLIVLVLLLNFAGRAVQKIFTPKVGR